MSVTSAVRPGTLPASARWREAALEARVEVPGEVDVGAVAEVVPLEVAAAITVVSPDIFPGTAPRNVLLAHLAPLTAAPMERASTVARRATSPGSAQRGHRVILVVVLTTGSVTTVETAVICRGIVLKEGGRDPVDRSATNAEAQITYSVTALRTPEVVGTLPASAVTTVTRSVTYPGTAQLRLRAILQEVELGLEPLLRVLQPLRSRSLTF